jgi:hypothetical protein
MNICTKEGCKTNNPDDAKFCRKCGSSLCSYNENPKVNDKYNKIKNVKIARGFVAVLKWILVAFCTFLFLNALVGYITPTLIFQNEDFRMYNTPILGFAVWNSQSIGECRQAIAPYLLIWTGAFISLALTFVIKRKAYITAFFFLLATILLIIPLVFMA